MKKSHTGEARGDDKEKRSSADKGKPTRPAEPEKDPHTLEREARNRERLLKEQQRREAVNADRDGKTGRRRDQRPERGLIGGRRLSYRYEDEADDLVRIEREREDGRWP